MFSRRWITPGLISIIFSYSCGPALLLLSQGGKNLDVLHQGDLPYLA